MNTVTASSELLTQLLKPLKKDSHKGDNGLLNIVAGSEKYRGAADLCVGGALRTGCGIVRLISEECDNLAAAKECNMPICQDTGMAVVFVDIGQQVCITDGSFEDAINEGVRQAYKEGYFRLSVVDDPLFNRKNTGDNTPAIIHTRIVEGDKIDIRVEPKGFGSENMSRIKMFNPSVDKQAIIDFAVQTVKEAGGNPCPPVVLGIGIGGTFDYCAVLAKKALTRNISERNADPLYAELENDILSALNETGVGPQGFGGKTTALAVNIEYFPTHIAGLPVAVNVNCHVARHAQGQI